MTPVEVLRGDGPVILGQPHGGTFVPPEIWSRLNETGQQLTDTDWHIGQLYDGLLPGVTTVRATFHRYVIDANRDPSGQSLYPGQNTTGLVPETDFDGTPIWRAGETPNAHDIAHRIAHFHRPYHVALEAEIERVKAAHGIAIVYDCHSIRSRIPFLFEGTLPVFNIGTDNGKTCAPRLQQLAYEFASSSPFPTVLNGRFRGGWTTRHYGQRQSDVHAIQMEIAQSAYLETEAAPWAYSHSKSAKLRTWLRDILHALSDDISDMSKDRLS